MRRRTSSTRSGRTRGAPAPAACRCAARMTTASLYAASRRGNFPLLRTYSGTDDFIRLAEMYVETINIAWCCGPALLVQRDGRPRAAGSRRFDSGAPGVMAWYGARGIPVELNEPHHWGMRDAPDVVFVARRLSFRLQRPRLRRPRLHRPVHVQQPARAHRTRWTWPRCWRCWS